MIFAQEMGEEEEPWVSERSSSRHEEEDGLWQGWEKTEITGWKANKLWNCIIFLFELDWEYSLAWLDNILLFLGQPYT